MPKEWWEEALEPFAEALDDQLGFHVVTRRAQRTVQQMVAGKSDEELVRLVSAANRPTEANCWYVIWQAAPIVGQAARRELARRAKAPEAREAPEDETELKPQAFAQIFRELVDAAQAAADAMDIPRCGVYYEGPACEKCKAAQQCAAYRGIVLAVNGAEAALAALEGDANGKDDVPRCRICGCTDDNACEGGCYWVEDPEGLGDLCSRCLAELNEKAAIQPAHQEGTAHATEAGD